MYVSQIIMLYTLNLHSAVGQLCLNKTRKKYEYQLGVLKTVFYHRRE